MIRLGAVMWLGLVIAMAVLLFRTSHDVGVLEDRLADLHRAASAEREAINVLRAEWAYLNNPDRLAGVAAALGPLQPASTIQVLHSVDRVALRPMVPEREDDAAASGLLPSQLMAALQPPPGAVGVVTAAPPWQRGTVQTAAFAAATPLPPIKPGVIGRAPDSAASAGVDGSALDRLLSEIDGAAQPAALAEDGR